MASPKIGTLILRNILRSVKSFILCSIGIVVGIAAFVFFVGLGDGLERIVQDRIFPSLPANQIEVVPRYAMVGKRVTSKMRMRKAAKSDAERAAEFSAKKLFRHDALFRIARNSMISRPIIYCSFLGARDAPGPGDHFD